MLNTMDNGTQAMTGFFDVLSSVIDPEFSRIDSKQKQREILRLMEKYGFVRRSTSGKSVPAWIVTRKLIREISGANEKHYDSHSPYMKIFEATADRVFREHEYVDLEDKWQLFQLRLPDIFELQYQHCLRWMRSDVVLLQNKDAFSRQALQKARAVLCASAISICAADMNTRIHERVIKSRKRRLKRRIRRELRRTAQAGTPDNVTVPVTEAMAEAKLQERTRLAE
jgi:hypothetical protein